MACWSSVESVRVILFNFYTQDQLGVGPQIFPVLLFALSRYGSAIIEAFIRIILRKAKRNAELEKGFGIFFAGNGSKKIKCIDS